MSQQQQTVLRVQTNKPSDITVTGNTSLSVHYRSTTGITYTGSGTFGDPYVGTFPLSSSYIEFQVSGDGLLNYNVSLTNTEIGYNYLQIFIKHPNEEFFKLVLTSFNSNDIDYLSLKDGDIIAIKQGSSDGGSFSVYVDGVYSTTNYTVPEFDNLDLYSDIPLTINKSFAEIQDVSKRNSDYSVGVKVPGSKKNNRFFEDFYNVDQSSLYFDVTSKVPCQVLINDEKYFDGFLRLNRVSVINSKIEYDVTLYSTIGDLYGSIGNNLLKDLDFRDVDYHFNHFFDRDNVIAGWRYETLKSTGEVPSNYFYPIMHNGYNYKVSGNTTSVLNTSISGTSYYTTTKLGSWANTSAAYAAGVERYYINSPEDGLRDNQLKPALNIYSLIKLIFKTYGYTIKSDFMSSPWMKLLYMYGYFSNDTAKLSYKVPQIQTFGLDGIEVILVDEINASSTSACFTTYPYTTHDWKLYVVKKGTGTPALCNQEIVLNWNFNQQPCYGGSVDYLQPIVIPRFATGTTFNYVQEQYVDCGYGCPFQPEYIYNYGFNATASNVGLSNKSLAYPPTSSNTIVEVVEGGYVDFSLIIDEQIKQIDILSSIAKKFGLLFIPDPEVPNQIIIEPYDYYVGSGEVYDWTDKLSYDKGFSVEPASNFVESEIILTDLEDGDAGNKLFKDSNSRIYGQNNVTNPTSFKSQKKDIKTEFSPQLVRTWNPNNNPEFLGTGFTVSIPLGINYTESSQEVGNKVDWLYKGVKTKPKLLYNMGNFSPFLDNPNEVFIISGTTTSYFRVQRSYGGFNSGGLISPVISHTMPIGNPDSNKINNDSICILFGSEQPTTIADNSISLFGNQLNSYTDQDTYNLFYENRISNSFDKNTRLISGYFDLKLSDIKNLKPQDLIKIKEQYFTWNKVENYNLTNPELTKVELIQTNYAPKQYPTRYFQYQYCLGDTGTTYNFKTEFTGTDSVYESLYYYSILYDYFVGCLGGNVSGYTSSISYTGSSYLPYSIWEVDKYTYDTSGTSYLNDPSRYLFLLNIEDEPLETIYNQNNPVWLINSTQTQARLNVFTSCSDFTTKATAIGVNIAGSPSVSTYNSGVTINVTDTGYIRYDTPSGTVDTYFGSLGSTVISGCVDCESLRYAYPLLDLGNWTLVSCGTPCP